MPTHPPMVLKNSAPWRLFPLLALIPLILTGAILAALYLNGTPLDELATPALGMGGLAVAIFLMLLLVAVISTLAERTRITHVRRNAWAVFPQFATESAWHAWADAEWARERKSGGFPWASVIVLAVVFTLITVVSATMLDAPPELFVGIGAMLLIIVGGLVIGTQAGRWAARRRYQRRRSSPVPVAYVGKWGIYDEDNGFETLFGLQKVAYVPEGAAAQAAAASEAYMASILDRDSGLALTTPAETRGWAEMRFTVRYWRAFRPDTWREYRGHITVRVPPGREGEAQALIQRYQAERL